jgi:hypothetical protein
VTKSLHPHIIILRRVVFDEDVFPLVGSSPPLGLNTLLDVDLFVAPPLPLPSVPLTSYVPRVAHHL